MLCRYKRLATNPFPKTGLAVTNEGDFADLQGPFDQ